MEKVKPGHAIKFKAQEWNQVVDATNHVNTTRARGGDVVERSRNYLVNGSDIVLGINGTGATINQFDAVVIGSVQPATSNAEWHQKIAVNVTTPTGSDCEKIAIAQEGFAAGEFGRILVSGISPARVDIEDASDDIAVGQAGEATLKSRGSTQSGKVGGQGSRITYTDGSTWSLVMVGNFTSCHATRYLGTLDGAIASDDDPLTATVDGLVALNGQATTEASLTAVNHFSWDADDGAKCLVEWDAAGSRWVLVQVAC